MGSPNILHMITPLKHMSPFDINMAIDAGYDHVIPYTQVTLEEIRGLVQDAMFSRAPHDGPRTGLFIGGKNAILALDMMSEAWEALVPPFAISIFADPAGSFTTAASVVACVEKKAREHTGTGLGGKNIAVFGGTGVVAFSVAALSALQGARVRLVGRDGDERVKRAAAEMATRFNVRVEGVDGSTEDKRLAIARDSQVIFSAAAAAARVLSFDVLEKATSLVVAADINAVPPSGIEGVNMEDNGVLIPGTNAVAIGPLAIGNVKYQTEAAMFRKMITSEKPIVLDVRDAYQLACELAAR